MPHLNLLPWREQKRKERQQQFFILLGLAAFLSILVVFIVDWHYGKKIEYQDFRNTYLQTQIARLDEKIKEVQSLEKERAQLLERINIIQALQVGRLIVVHIFDELVTSIPDGVFLTEVALTEKPEDEASIKTLTIKGVAESNARVSNFMRNIEASPWLKDPHLKIVETVIQDGRRLSQFILDVLGEIPQSELVKGEKAG